MSLTDWVAVTFGPRRVPGKRRNLRKLSEQVERAEERCLLSAIGGELYSPTEAYPGGGQKGGGAGKMNPLTSIPPLHSRAGAPVNIFLDFDGHTETQDWPGARTDGQSGPVVTPVFDVDNDFTTFSDEELRLIEEIWYRVAEDYSPFNVDVTTVDPGSYNNFETILISIGGNGSWIGSPGGIAWLNSFNNSLVNTVYVFSDNTALGSSIHAKGTALAASHEAGHALGLLHHSVYDAAGNKTAEYDPGSATLGPIMGAPYTSERETWSDAADSNGVNSFQDDLVMMTRPLNQTFRFRADDHGNTFATATDIPINAPDFTIDGVIETTNDIDMFGFETNSGPITLSVDGLDLADVFGLTSVNAGTNLDLVMRLYDEQGVLVLTSNPTSSLNASLSLSVPAGRYFVAISNTGEYGALGQYTLTGTVIPLPKVPTMIAPVGSLDQPVPTFEWTVAGAAVSYDLEVDNLTTGQSRFYTRNVAGTIHTAASQFPQGSFQARVRSVSADGSVSNWSTYLPFQIDIPTPAKPLMLRPVGDVATSFPTFIWEGVEHAAEYALWVNELDSGKRVIYRTNYTGTEYTHFDPLLDGTYRAWVQAKNSLGESSPWSDYVEFTIDVPAPIATKITAPVTPTTNVNPRIVWDAVDGAYEYDLWVDYRTGGQPQYIRDMHVRGQNWYDPLALPQGFFQAWVRAANANGETAPWSPTYSFTVDILPPDRPTMTGPAGPNGERTISSANPVFTWTQPERAVRYDLWVNNETTGQIQIIRQQNLLTNSFTAATNLPQGFYRAWVRGINSAGELGSWSNAYAFTIDDPIPSVPVVTGPLPNPAGAVEDDTPTITWSSEIQGEYYDLWIDNNSLNKAQYIRQPRVEDESWTVPDNMRLDEHVFTIWVRAANVANEFSGWSQPYKMRIDVPNPTTPEIVSPGGTIKDTTPKFEWTHSTGSVKYEILVRDLERQENIVLNVTSFKVSPDGTLASYEVPPEKALQKGTYRFWIRAFNSQGHSSSWSASRSFVIAQTTTPLSPDLFQQAGDPVVVRRLVQTGQEGEFANAQPDVEAFVVTETAAGVPAADAVEMPESTPDLDDCHTAVMSEFAQPAEFTAVDHVGEPSQDVRANAVSLAAALGLLPVTLRRRKRNSRS